MDWTDRRKGYRYSGFVFAGDGGGVSRVLRTPHHGAAVLYLCLRCRTFFEHGHIDGGWPWK